MAQPRSKLHNIFVEILGLPEQVYFQPPANVQMKYPCIVYQRDHSHTQFAGNLPYLYEKRYQVTVIDRDPDSEIPDKIAALPKTLFSRFFAVDNLNHDVFDVYF